VIHRSPSSRFDITPAKAPRTPLPIVIEERLQRRSHPPSATIAQPYQSAQLLFGCTRNLKIMLTTILHRHSIGLEDRHP
jgi:hypothetical protein